MNNERDSQNFWVQVTTVNNDLRTYGLPDFSRGRQIGRYLTRREAWNKVLLMRSTDDARFIQVFRGCTQVYSETIIHEPKASPRSLPAKDSPSMSALRAEVRALAAHSGNQ